jgi:hypothetical protein
MMEPAETATFRITSGKPLTSQVEKSDPSATQLPGTGQARRLVGEKGICTISLRHAACPIHREDLHLSKSTVNFDAATTGNT